MRRLLAIHCLTAIALGSHAGLAQPQFPHENHYLAYEIAPQAVLQRNLGLIDQFGPSNYQTLWNVYFANPVEKNQSTIYFPQVHHDWWIIGGVDIPEDPIRRVQLENQFGRQTWTVGQAQYLLAPASKSLPPQPPPPPPPDNLVNHYKCYSAEGPSASLMLTLRDQFGELIMTEVIPRWFCNPVEKTDLDTGEVSPIVDPESHLACYEVAPIAPVMRPLIARDQFGIWNTTTVETRFLCLPTTKLQVIATQERSWGFIKKLYE